MNEERLLKIITNILEQYGMPKFKDQYPAIEVLKLVEDYGYSKPIEGLNDAFLSKAGHMSGDSITGDRFIILKRDWNEIVKSFGQPAQGLKLLDDKLVWNIINDNMPNQEVHAIDIQNATKAIIATFGQPNKPDKPAAREIEWPAKREEFDGEGYEKGFNAAIDLCKAAHNKAQEGA